MDKGLATQAPLNVDAHRHWRCQIPRSHRRLWDTWHASWKLNSGPLQEQNTLLTDEPSLQLSLSSYLVLPPSSQVLGLQIPATMPTGTCKQATKLHPQPLNFASIPKLKQCRLCLKPLSFLKNDGILSVPVRQLVLECLAKDSCVQHLIPGWWYLRVGREVIETFWSGA